MSWSLDARIPLTFVAQAALADALAEGKPAAVLTEAPAPARPAGAAALEGFEAGGPVHAAACACCTGRPPVSLALDRLFQARVRGQCAWFARVIAATDSAEARAAIEAALEGDALTRARFRLG